MKNKIVEYNFQFHAHNGSWFDTWVLKNSLLCDKCIVIIVKKGKCNIELKVFNGHIGNEQTSQYIHFRCGRIHLNYSPNKLGKTFKLQKELLKTEMNQDETDGKTYEDKKR